MPAVRAPPRNGVLSDMDSKVLFLLCKRLGVREPKVVIEDDNLVTVTIMGFSFCMSREVKRKAHTFRSLTHTRRSIMRVNGFRVTAYQDGDEIHNEWYGNLEQSLGYMFSIIVAEMADDIGRTEQMILDAKERDPDAEKDPRTGISWSPAHGFERD